jgi:hypothetical protein
VNKKGWKVDKIEKYETSGLIKLILHHSITCKKAVNMDINQILVNHGYNQVIKLRLILMKLFQSYWAQTNLEPDPVIMLKYNGDFGYWA